MIYGIEESRIFVKPGDTRLTARYTDPRMLKGLAITRHLAFYLAGISPSEVATLDLSMPERAGLPVSSILRGLTVCGAYEAMFRPDNVETTNRYCHKYDPFRGRGLWGLTWGSAYAICLPGSAIPVPGKKNKFTIVESVVNRFLNEPGLQLGTWATYFDATVGIGSTRVSSARGVIERISGTGEGTLENRTMRFNHCVNLKRFHAEGLFNSIPPPYMTGAIDSNIAYYLLLKPTK